MKDVLGRGEHVQIAGRSEVRNTKRSRTGGKRAEGCRARVRGVRVALQDEGVQQRDAQWRVAG